MHNSLLAKAAGLKSDARVYYTDFDELCTFKHGVVIEGYPFERFTPPSDMSLKQLKEIKKSFEDDNSRFRLLNKADMKQWKKEYSANRDTTTIPAISGRNSERIDIPKGKRKRADVDA